MKQVYGHTLYVIAAMVVPVLWILPGKTPLLNKSSFLWKRLKINQIKRKKIMKSYRRQLSKTNPPDGCSKAIPDIIFSYTSFTNK